VIRIVVDTNVYISALVFGGKPAFALQEVEARNPTRRVQGTRI
jgi:predicted nucleic acid-binding protein